jgi:Zn-dependent peptidase ImmA (M78 family)
MLIRRKMIRERAVELLDRYDVKKAPVDVEKIVERMGIEVVREPAEDSLSGFILRDPKRPKVLLGVNENHHPNRQRFTIAHECGHFLLHQGEKLHVDKESSGYQIKLRDAESSTGKKIDEMEANLFAAELLMPVRFLDLDLAKNAPMSLSDDAMIKKLAEKYKVSAQALTLRLTYLGCIQQ